MMEIVTMRGNEKRQGDFISEAVYSVIPRDHRFRRLRELLAWEELAAGLSDCYEKGGRPSIPPEVMLRICLLQFLEDRSDRQMEEDLLMHNGYKLFVGLAADQAGPDHSTISRFRDRVGPARFAALFNKIVAAAREAGIIADRLHAIDSRAVRANVATWRKRDDHDDDGGPGGFVKFDPGPPGSPDPDAAWGRKNKRTSFLGYKHHMAVDADSGLITSTRVTPGNESAAADGVVMAQVLDGRAAAVVADKAYDLPRNHRLLQRKGIDNRIIKRRGGNGSNNAQRYVVERSNAIVKRWCGGGRARYWGLEKVSIQMLLASMAANLKRWLGIAAPAVAAAG